MTRNKKIGVVITIVLLLSVAGAIAYFTLAGNNDGADTTANDQNNVPAAPEVPEGPRQAENQSVPDNMEPIDEPSSTQPEGTLSPHKVVTNLDQYFDQELRLYGLIVETSAGNYSISSQNPNESQGIRMVVSDNIDMTEHVSKVKTATGQLVVLEDNTVAFKATSME